MGQANQVTNRFLNNLYIPSLCYIPRGYAQVDATEEKKVVCSCKAKQVDRLAQI